MKVRDLVEFLSECPQDAVVGILYPEDEYGKSEAVDIDEVAFFKRSDNKNCGVFIKI